MKIIFLCSNYEPGGAQRLIFKLEKSFEANGLECQSWYFHRKYKNFNETNPVVILNRKIKSPIDLIICIIKLIMRFKKEKPDAIYSSLPYANTIGLFIAWMCGIKIRIASHHNESQNELSYLSKFLDCFCVRFGIYTKVIAVSEPTKKSFSYYPKKKYELISVINNGIKFTNTIKSVDDCRSFFSFDKNAFIIGAIGRLEEQKNHIFLINILPHLVGITLVIVGKGKLKPFLLSRAKELEVSERLIIIDEVNTENIPEFLKSIDIYIMPSIFEGLSVSLIEALHARLPIITSDIPSQNNVLYNPNDKSISGYLINLNKPKKWISTILFLRDNKSELKKLSLLSHNRAKDFKLEKMTNQYLELLK